MIICSNFSIWIYISPYRFTNCITIINLIIIIISWICWFCFRYWTWRWVRRWFWILCWFWFWFRFWRSSTSCSTTYIRLSFICVIVIVAVDSCGWTSLTFAFSVVSSLGAVAWLSFLLLFLLRLNLSLFLSCIAPWVLDDIDGIRPIAASEMFTRLAPKVTIDIAAIIFLPTSYVLLS